MNDMDLFHALCPHTRETVPLRAAPRPEEMEAFGQAREAGQKTYPATRYCPFCEKEHEFQIEIRHFPPGPAEQPMGSFKSTPTYSDSLAPTYTLGAETSQSQKVDLIELEPKEVLEARQILKKARSLLPSKLPESWKKALLLFEDARVIMERYHRDREVTLIQRDMDELKSRLSGV